MDVTVFLAILAWSATCFYAGIQYRKDHENKKRPPVPRYRSFFCD